MSDVSDLDDLIAAAPDGSDEKARLFVQRGELLGHHIRADHLVYLMGVSLDDANAIWQRLADEGVVEAVPSPSGEELPPQEPPA